ncbi:hypothetical protein, partial [Nostoc sp. 106C]|uniref:hypothetical protein n=1 Tax=Nostoc sp. 106C TaxID=1932667 RepID=UPI001AA1D29C
GFPDLSEVAFELSETQQLQGFEVLGFVPQPNLHPHHIFCEMVSVLTTFQCVPHECDSLKLAG